MVALASVHLSWVSEMLPPVMMAAPAAAAALLMVTLPDTATNCALPETWEETIVLKT